MDRTGDGQLTRGSAPRSGAFVFSAWLLPRLPALASYVDVYIRK